MSFPITDAVLAALKKVEPSVGYMYVERGPDEEGADRTGIDGWAFTTELEASLREALIGDFDDLVSAVMNRLKKTVGYGEFDSDERLRVWNYCEYEPAPSIQEVVTAVVREMPVTRTGNVIVGKTSSLAYETGVIAGKGAAAGLLRDTADEYEQQFGRQNRTAAVLIYAATLIEEQAKDARGLDAAAFTREGAIEYFAAAARLRPWMTNS